MRNSCVSPSIADAIRQLMRTVEHHTYDTSAAITLYTGITIFVLRSAGTLPRQQEEDNAAWLEECAVRLLCVLALDRFGDYVSDQVA
jgi:hypothetical protein